MDRDELLSQLTALDFMAVDLALFLDTHPKNTDAIELYNKIVKAAASVRKEYEKHSGPLCSFRSLSGTHHFNWIDEPWPWEYCANYNLKGENC